MKLKSKDILQNLINGEKSFCTLCFSSIDDLENYLNVTDKVILKTEDERSIVDILNFILSPGVSTDFLTTYICTQCAKSALSSYLFIQMVKENSEYLTKTIKNVTNILKSSLEENLEFCKTLYLLNEDSKFLSCYDTECEINSIETARLRLNTILLEINNEENVISINIEFEPQENEPLKHGKQEYKQLTHREEGNDQLKHRKKENEELKHREEENEQLKHGEEENEQLKHREERNKLLKLREEENEQLKHGEEENEQLKHGEEEKEQLKHREERNKLLKLREEENEQLKHGEEENEQLKHGEEEKKQLQHGKENTKQIALENMCERVGKSVQCKLCSRVFAAITYFNRHYYRLHAPKTIKCPKCPKLFGSARMLNEHTYNYHIEAICTECGKAFNNRSISKHKQSHHINFPCKKCKHVYKTQNAYDRHLRFQRCGQKQNKTQADAIFTCDICDKNFCHKTSLNRHIGFMHGNGNVCKWCNKKYSTQSRLNAHIVKHTQCKNLSCTVCNGKFIKNDLNIHTKPYKCVNCDASFICSTQRSMHAQRYPYHRLVPDLQFECHICCRKFYQKYSLERHNKEVKCHNNKKVSTLARIRKNIARQCYYKTNIIF